MTTTRLELADGAQLEITTTGHGDHQPGGIVNPVLLALALAVGAATCTLIGAAIAALIHSRGADAAIADAHLDEAEHFDRLAVTDPANADGHRALAEHHRTIAARYTEGA